ncbi:MAG: Mth938-like domain-containing protein [Devosiaceae bacterium]|nr:Mth938-like domain-containing protein [Devosiaceae bacterium MH13]
MAETTDDDRFLPEQAPIDAVLDGGFRFAGLSHQGSLIGLPGRTQNWLAPASAFDVSVDDLQPILDQAEALDILVLGTGRDPAVLPDETTSALRDAGIAVELSPTRSAVRTYNILLSEDRRVAAALMVIR